MKEEVRKKMKILVAMPVGIVRDTFFSKENMERLEEIGEVEWNTSTEQFSSDELREKLQYVDVVITGWKCPRLDQYILEKTDQLKLVIYTAGSVNHLVSDYLYDKGIKVISGNALFAEGVAEGTLAYMLCALRRIPFFMKEVKEGRWKNKRSFSQGLMNKTVGLVGFGMIAKKLVGLLKPFHTKIKVYDPYITEAVCKDYGVEEADLEEIFSACQIISIHAPSTTETYHMIGRELLEKMEEGAVLVNTARGEIIDEQALVEELRKNRFQAILDVYEKEPLDLEHPLREIENVILMPHLAGPPIDKRIDIARGLMEDMKRYFDGNSLQYEISKEYAARMSKG